MIKNILILKGKYMKRKQFALDQLKTEWTLRLEEQSVHILDCASNMRPVRYTWQTVAATKYHELKLNVSRNYIDSLVHEL